MNLTELVFKTATQELLDAKKAIDNLGTSMKNLNKITADETKAAIDNEKVKQQQAKTAEAVAKAKLVEEKANRSSSESVKENTSVLERQQNILSYMTQGYSKGQATVLAYAQASGAATAEIKELGNVLEVQRKLMGASPFDKSMSGLVALKNQYGEMREAIRQYNADSGLSSNQTRELARDKERIIEKLKQEGAGLTQIKQAIREYNSAYIDTAAKVNTLSKAEKDRERVMRDTANAARNIQAAEERLFATVSHLGDVQSNNIKVNERAALALGSYERNLRLAGITGEEAAKKLAKFKAAQEQVSAAEANNRAAYVSRGVGVQLGDVGVSLASGMNPLIVAIQQGDQLRSIIQQSGLESAQMAGIMKQAFAGIITSFKDVGIAMGSFIVGGLQSMGKSFLDLTEKMLPFKATLSFIERKLPDAAGSIGVFTKALAENKIVTGLFGAGLMTVVTIISTSLIALYKETKALDTLNESLVLYGARLNSTKEEILALSQATAGMGTTSNEMLGFFTEIAKGGFNSKESLQSIGNAAKELSSVTSLSLSEIAKMYVDLGNDPVKALTKLGLETGYVTSSTIQYVHELVKQGNQQEAVSYAAKAMAEAHSKAAKDIENSLSPIGAILIGLEDLWKKVKQSAIDFGNEISTIFLWIGKKVAEFDIWQKKKSLERSFYAGEINQSELDAGIKALESQDKAVQDRYDNIVKGNTAVTDSIRASNAEQVRLGNLKIAAWEKLNKQEDTVLAKQLSKRQYFNLQLDKYQKEQLGGAAASPEFLPLLKEKFGKEWDTANSKSTQEANKVTNEYLKTLEKFLDIKIQVASATATETDNVEMTTKSYAALRDILNDKAWASYDLKKKESILLAYESAAAVEMDAKAKKAEAAALLEITKIQNDFNTARQLQILGIEAKTKDIGLTEEQRLVNAELLKIEQDRIKAIEGINLAAAKAQKEGSKYDQAGAIEAANKAAEESKALVKQVTEDNYKQQTSFSAGWDTAFANYTDQARNAAKTGQMLFERMADGMTDAIVQFAMTGKLSIRDFASTFLAEMLKMQVRAAAASVMGNSSSGIGSLLRGIFTGGTQAPAPVVTPTMQTSGPEIYQIPGMGTWSSGGYTGAGGKNQPAGIVHKGEVVWSQEDVSRAGGVAVVDAMRRGVNGYATGGIVGNTANSSSRGDTSVVVNNYTSSNITTEEVPDGRGGRKVNIIISEIAGNEVRRPGSPLNSSIRNSFGLAPALNGR